MIRNNTYTLLGGENETLIATVSNCNGEYVQMRGDAMRYYGNITVTYFLSIFLSFITKSSTNVILNFENSNIVIPRCIVFCASNLHVHV